MSVQGSMRAAEHVDLLIGRAREAVLPYPADAIHPFYPVWYSLDGILDEVKIYSRSLTRGRSAEELCRCSSALG